MSLPLTLRLAHSATSAPMADSSLPANRLVLAIATGAQPVQISHDVPAYATVAAPPENLRDWLALMEPQTAGSWINRFSTALGRFSGLKESWDSAGAKRPSAYAIQRTAEVLDAAW